jgi:hypothetical protein
MLYTVYQNNPFYILGITTRDNRQKIVQIAEDKSLELDNNICQKARSELTTPKSRIKAELCWFPGLSPKRIGELISQLQLNPYTVENISALPNLAHANLLLFAIQQIDTDHTDVFVSMIEQIIDLTEAIQVNEIIRDINEERSVSGFPEVFADTEVEEILSEIKRFYVKTIIAKFNEMPPKKLVEIMTRLVDDATGSGEYSCSVVIDDIVDDYVIHTQQFLEDEADNIKKIMDAIRDRAEKGEAFIEKLITKLITITANWDSIAQPIQLSYKTRGIDHDPSNRVGYGIRSLSVDLFNKFDYMEQTKRLNTLLHDYFSELPELLEKIEEDTEALDDIFKNRQNQVNKNQEWINEITYSTEIGAFFKDTLSISEKGVSWKDHHYPLDLITRISWGGTSHSVNGIPTGTTYTVSFGDKRYTTTVELKKENVYSTFIDKLWRAVGIRILTDMLTDFKRGEGLIFELQKTTIFDDGVVFTKFKWFGDNEKIKLGWEKIQIWSSNGNFVIGSTDQNKFAVELPYISLYNIHILEHAIRMKFKDGSIRKLSDLLA